MREQKAKAQVKQTNKQTNKGNTHPPVPPHTPDINQPPSAYPIPTSFIMTAQWRYNSQCK